MPSGTQRPAEHNAGKYINILDMSANNKVEKPADSTTLPGLLGIKQGQIWKTGAFRIVGRRKGEQ